MAAVSTSSLTTIENNSSKCNRLDQYKVRNNVSNQEERRWKLLQEQKKKRDESFNASRGLIEEIESVAGEQDAMEWTSSKIKSRVQKLYTNRLMFSEWLEHIPEDLAQLWYLVPCPVGRRALVVASGGNTRSYTKVGIQTATFISALPGGSSEDSKGCTILDCIWSCFNHTYYVLDVLAWGNQPFLDCETEFRFYWLKSKVGETPSLSESTDDNAYPFIPLDCHPCDPIIMANVMGTEHIFGENGPKLDGLLFYHSQTHYIPGSTPLVGWLKPHMMPVVLGVPVAEIYLNQEAMEGDRRSIRRRRRKHRKACKNIEVEMEEKCVNGSAGEMETSGLEETDSSRNTSCNENTETKDENCASCLEEMEPQD